MLGGRVDVDHELDVVDVDAARGDVRRDEHLHGAGRERLEVALARALPQVAVQVHRRDAGLGELLRQLLRAVLGPREQDAAAGARGEVEHDVALRGHVLDGEHVVRHRGDGRAVRVDRVAQRVGEELGDEPVHAVVERRGEQHPLAAPRRGRQDPADARQEAEVGHVVRLVEHGHLHVRERHDALAHEVLEPAGARDDDVDARAQRLLLRALGDATEDRGDAQAGGTGERLERRGDLGRELARGGEDEPAGPAGRGPGGAGPRRQAREARDEREAEGERLARAGAAAAEHVAAAQGVGQRRRLDREGVGHAAGGERADEGLGHAEGGERGHRGRLSGRREGARQASASPGTRARSGPEPRKSRVHPLMPASSVVAANAEPRDSPLSEVSQHPAGRSTT